MPPRSRIKRHLLLLALALTAAGGSQAQTMQRGPLRNPHGATTIPCGSCHTSISWSPLRAVLEFDHNRETKYPLRGMHANVECRLCHATLVFRQASTTCADCHADIHRRQFGANCTQCHTVAGWDIALQSTRQHSVRFPLIGGHAGLECEACHKGAGAAQFTALSIQCGSCHIAGYNNAKTIDHRAAGFPTACEACHGIDGWTLGVRFDHARFTGFALVGMHAGLDCVSCHVGAQFKGTPANCYACHVKDYTGATNPNHVSAGFSTSCSLCHGADTWLNAHFDHSATKFPLTGAHASVACAQCHVNNQFSGTPTQCQGCHLIDFNKTANPNHVAAGFPQDCSLCHTTTTWLGAAFDHNKTVFPLTGAHVSLACSQCHVNGQFSSTPTPCQGCHLADFNKTTNPNHTSAGFPQDCSLCHTTATWAGAVFDHSKTVFPLTGAHASVACAQCHANNQFAGAPTQCQGCHLADFNKTTDPNHVTAGFPQDCSVCHSTVSWAGAVFDHSKTGFALTGAHTSLQCAQCHATAGQFTGLSPACVSCHLSNFNSANSPNHVASGFPQTCEVCHTTTAWTPATFDHSATRFPLTGAHVSVACASCHINNVFVGTPTDCYSCHKAQYQTTTNPNHVASAFPTTCADCHNTTTWSGATFTHARFPIYSGTHANRWTTCADCHTNPSNYQVFSCITCHTHDQASTDPHHRGVRNYSYGPTTCYTCHPTGRGGD